MIRLGLSLTRDGFHKQKRSCALSTPQYLPVGYPIKGVHLSVEVEYKHVPTHVCIISVFEG
jgi:hypothetical protein